MKWSNSKSIILFPIYPSNNEEGNLFYINSTPNDTGYYDSWIAVGNKKKNSNGELYNNWKFYVAKDGTLFAKGAIIEGNSVKYQTGTDEDGNPIYEDVKTSISTANGKIDLVVSTAGDGTSSINGYNIASAISLDESAIKLISENIEIEAPEITLKGQTIKIDGGSEGIVAITSTYFNVDGSGKITATGGTIGGWQIG